MDNKLHGLSSIKIDGGIVIPKSHVTDLQNNITDVLNSGFGR